MFAPLHDRHNHFHFCSSQHPPGLCKIVFIATLCHTPCPPQTLTHTSTSSVDTSATGMPAQFRVLDSMPHADDFQRAGKAESAIESVPMSAANEFAIGKGGEDGTSASHPWPPSTAALFHSDHLYGGKHLVPTHGWSPVANMATTICGQCGHLSLWPPMGQPMAAVAISASAAPDDSPLCLNTQRRCHSRSR